MSHIPWSDEDFARELATWTGTAPFGRVSVPGSFLVELVRRYTLAAAPTLAATLRELLACQPEMGSFKWYAETFARWERAITAARTALEKAGVP